MTEDEPEVARWTEHQRRFLVTDLASVIGDRPDGNEIEQGYVWIDDRWEIRVRPTRVAPDRAGFNGEAPAVRALKGPSVGFTRPECEVSIALPHAIELMARSVAGSPRRATTVKIQSPDMSGSSTSSAALTPVWSLQKSNCGTAAPSPRWGFRHGYDKKSPAIRATPTERLPVDRFHSGQAVTTQANGLTHARAGQQKRRSRI